MQITPDHVRDMLRADAVGLALGALLLLTGLLALVLWAATRGRTTLLPKGHAAGGAWLAVFAVLYGTRLLVRTSSLRLFFDVSPAVFRQVAAIITYIVPLPFFLFLREFLPSWRRVATVVAIGLAVFAVCAIASDLILQRADSARPLNNLIAVTFIIAALAALFRPGLTLSRELRTVRIGVLAVALTAIADNLRGVHLVRYPGPDLEPLGFTVLLVSLAIVAATRILRDGRRLAAIDRELNIARQIQSSILPQVVPSVPGVSLAARYQPMTAVAGDFYDFLQIDDQRIGVLVADVSGHGVPAAIIASMVKVALAAQQSRADQPAALLAGMNETLCGRLGGQFVTAAYLFIDARSGLIRYSAAGHPPMLRSSARSPEVRELEKNGFALGFIETAGYESLEQPLEVGDRLLLYTDGLIEAANAAEDLFGMERLKEAVAAASALPPDAAADVVIGTMQAWSGQPPGDDLTIVMVDRK